MTLPKHLKKFFDTSSKRKTLDNLISTSARKEKIKMASKGYKLKGNKWIK
jgi:hypothetical protein